MNLNNILDLLAGGPGSGCRGPHCGRPLTSKERKKWVAKQIKKMSQVETKTAKKYWRKELKRQSKQKPEVQVDNKKAKKALARRLAQKKVQKWLKRNAAKIRNKAEPTTIDVQAPAKRWVDQSVTTNTGAQHTTLRPKQSYEKSGSTWARKISPYKGQFVRELELPTIYNDKEINSVFTAKNDENERAVTVFVHRNFGDLHVTVREVRLEGTNQRSGTREAKFKNIGKAAGMLNHRYGITFKFKKGKK